MKLAIISDIHGNYEALKSVLAAIDGQGISDIYCAGDVVGFYSQVNECCDELRRRKVQTVMGNHDWYMASGGFCARGKAVNDCLRYLRTVIRPDNISWLRGLPVQLFFEQIQMVHGGWSDPIDEYLIPSAEYFDRIEGRFFVSGHRHIQSVERFGDKLYCNPGSVGQPRDNDPRAAFAVFDGSEFTLHRVDYNMQPVFDLMDAAGFSDYYYRCLMNGTKIQ
ncbi:MAG: metallophosphoesterase family protein [Candidatus Pacebacteria bacterium]|nr:metallophosphoesterase family protein [Candidatus Paceibacterota bacterium]